MNRKFMIDFETLDTKPSSIVLSLGMVEFAPGIGGAPMVSNEQYWVFEQPSQIYNKRTQSASTIEWWKKQSPAARQILDDVNDPTKVSDTDMVLQEVAAILKAAETSISKPTIYANGPTFDNMILASLYESYGLRQPWTFTKDRCFRTVQSDAYDMGIRVNHPRQGTAHNALDDARHQAEVASLLMMHMQAAGHLYSKTFAKP